MDTNGSFPANNERMKIKFVSSGAFKIYKDSFIALWNPENYEIEQSGSVNFMWNLSKTFLA